MDKDQLMNASRVKSVRTDEYHSNEWIVFYFVAYEINASAVLLACAG